MRSDAAWWTAGLLLGSANTVRHRVAGYRTPRPFGADDAERNVDHVLRVADRWTERGGLDPAGRRVLELGPGPDLGTGAVLLARGATAYTAVDGFALAHRAGPGFYTALGRRLGRAVDPAALVFKTGAFPALAEVDGPFDAVVSNATLEHLPGIPALFARLAELTAPGAVMIHHVDAATHMRWVRERDPLNILRYRPRLYRALLGFPGAPNRLRASDHLAAARAAGFRARIVPGRTLAPEEAAAVRLAPPFRGRDPEDLRLLSFTLVAER